MPTQQAITALSMTYPGVAAATTGGELQRESEQAPALAVVVAVLWPWRVVAPLMLELGSAHPSAFLPLRSTLLPALAEEAQFLHSTKCQTLQSDCLRLLRLSR